MTDATTDATESADDADPGTDDTTTGAASTDEPIALFGDARSHDQYVTRGPDRRASHHTEPVEPAVDSLRHEEHHTHIPRQPSAGRAVRLGRGDGWATALNSLGIVILAGSVIAGILILNNAQDVGAFDDPWNSNRVAIGLAVLGVGISQALILMGVARAITYQLATLRLKLYEIDQSAHSLPG